MKRIRARLISVIQSLKTTVRLLSLQKRIINSQVFLRISKPNNLIFRQLAL